MIAALLLLASLAQAQSIPYARVVDLTQPFNARTLCWPTERAFSAKKEAPLDAENGAGFESYSFCASEHAGTHVDAPRHLSRDGATVDALPWSQLIGKFVVVDVSAQAQAMADFQIRLSDLLDWENAHGRIPDGAILLIETGYGSRWPSRAGYLGTSLVGRKALAALRFPGLRPDAAQWLLRERKISAVGIDTAGIDYGLSRDFGSEKALLAAGVPVFENLAGLNLLPSTGGWLIALPMKITGGAGAPLRVIALLPE